jgi:hypothetical protein
MTEIGQSSKEKAIFHTVFMTNHGDGQKLDALTPRGDDALTSEFYSDSAGSTSR